jgi:hypothetical protein
MDERSKTVFLSYKAQTLIGVRMKNLIIFFLGASLSLLPGIITTTPNASQKSTVVTETSMMTRFECPAFLSWLCGKKS